MKTIVPVYTPRPDLSLTSRQETQLMSVRLSAILFAGLVAVGLSGCAHDPFACCDQRPSLADWFDMYGPIGCYKLDGSPRCAGGNCR